MFFPYSMRMDLRQDSSLFIRKPARREVFIYSARKEKNLCFKKPILLKTFKSINN